MLEVAIVDVLDLLLVCASYLSSLGPLFSPSLCEGAGDELAGAK